MSAGTELLRNQKAREAELRAARLTLSQLIVATATLTDEALASLDLVRIRLLIDQIENHKRNMEHLRAEYAELAALAGGG